MLQRLLRMAARKPLGAFVVAAPSRMADPPVTAAPVAAVSAVVLSQTSSSTRAISSFSAKPSSARFSTAGADAQPADGQQPQTAVLARRSQNLRVFVLNRPAVLNSLNLNMIQLMTPQLKAWDDSDQCTVILLMGVEGCRAFCAGGDVKDVVTKASTRRPEEIAEALKFFQDEYQLNHLIGTLKKPFISLMNGITMGGGVGLSVHAPFRIVTENTRFAMPETAIGLFPDVGGSFFLPRLDGELGTYLALTGATLKGEDVLFSGIGTHYIPSDKIPSLLARLAEIETDELDVINMVLEEYVVDQPLKKWQTWSLGGETAEVINRCFKYDSIEEIVNALESENTAWANDTLTTLKKMSPTSLKVTLLQLRQGRKLDFAQCLRMEYNMAKEFLRTPDFVEGVTAKLVEKREPVWSPSWENMGSLKPSLLHDVYFKRAPAVQSGRPKDSRLPSEDLVFLNKRSYYEYPHHTLSGLPTDRDIEDVMTGKSRRNLANSPITKPDDVVNTFLGQWGGYDPSLIFETDQPADRRAKTTIAMEGGFGRGKSGLKEKVTAYLERRAKL